MRLRIAVLVLIFASSAATLHAGTCGKPHSQFEMTDCANSELRTSDARLNAIYKEIVRRLHGAEPARQLLVSAETAWIQFRDAECMFSTSSAEDGSVHPMLAASCKTTLTKERIKQLNAYLNCEEGDMSCPVPQD